MEPEGIPQQLDAPDIRTHRLTHHIRNGRDCHEGYPGRASQLQLSRSIPMPVSPRFARTCRQILTGVTVAALLAVAVPQQALAEQDDYDLLPEGEGRDETFGLCSGCHSIKLVVQQGLPRWRWDELLDWMVADQGMAEVDAETRKIVLDYLDKHLNTDHRPTYIQR